MKEGRVWVYVKDDRPWAGSDPPAAAYWFAPDHKGEHAREHLADFNGILQADALYGIQGALRARPRRRGAGPRGGVLGPPEERLP